jgi:hypothetical protein
MPGRGVISAHRTVVEPERPPGEVPLFVLEDPRTRPLFEEDLDLPSLTGGSSEDLTLSNRSTASVEALRNQTAGAARVERRRIGPATREATVSAPLSARRLGTSSPRIRVS